MFFTRKRLAVGITALATTIAAVITLAPSATAGGVYTVKTATIPSGGNGAPEPGGGARLTNKPFGYYIGRAMENTRFVSMGSLKNHHWGRAIEGVDMCAYIHDSGLGAPQGDGNNSCGNETEAHLAHRLSVGKDFNFPPHVGNNPSPVTALNPECVFHFNYFQGSDFASNGGHWANPAGPMGTAIEYRFTTLDGGAYVVRHPVWGWGFIQAGCTDRPADLNNEDD